MPVRFNPSVYSNPEVDPRFKEGGFMIGQGLSTILTKPAAPSTELITSGTDPGLSESEGSSTGLLVVGGIVLLGGLAAAAYVMTRKKEESDVD